MWECWLVLTVEPLFLISARFADCAPSAEWTAQGNAPIPVSSAFAQSTSVFSFPILIN